MLLDIISLFSFRFSFIVCFLCRLFSRFFSLSLLWRFLVSFLVHILSCLLMACGGGRWWLRPGGWWLVAGGRWWLVMNWFSKVEFCSIRVSKKVSMESTLWFHFGLHIMVPIWGPHELFIQKMVFKKRPSFGDHFWNFFVFFFQLFLKSGGLDGRDGGCGGGGGGEGGGGGVCRIC